MRWVGGIRAPRRCSISTAKRSWPSTCCMLSTFKQISLLLLATSCLLFRAPNLQGQHSEQPVPRSETDPRVRTLKGRAADAKAIGRPQIAFFTPEEIPVFIGGMQDALAKYSAVVASPVALQTLVESTHLFTWYLLDIDRSLVEHAPVIATGLQLDQIPESVRPTKLLPIKSNGIDLAVPGGTAVIDGVSVTELENGSTRLELNKKYLLLLELSSDRLARLPFGMAGVFAIGADGETLSQMTTLKTPITNDVTTSDFRTLSHLVSTFGYVNN